MRIKNTIGLFVVATMLVLSTFGCGKEKCGCDGEQVFTLSEEPGFIYYDSVMKTSTWRPKYMYGTFTICHPQDKWALITRFDNGEEVLVSGSVSDDCIRLTNPYAQGYYVLRVDTLKINQFGI